MIYALLFIENHPEDISYSEYSRHILLLDKYDMQDTKNSDMELDLKLDILKIMTDMNVYKMDSVGFKIEVLYLNATTDNFLHLQNLARSTHHVKNNKYFQYNVRLNVNEEKLNYSFIRVELDRPEPDEI